MDNLPGGQRSLVLNKERVEAVQPLLGLMRDIGSAHGGKTCGQARIVMRYIALIKSFKDCKIHHVRSRCWS